MAMITVQISDEMAMGLSLLAKRNGRHRSYYIQEALKQYLEDHEDYLLALAALEAKERYISIK